MHTVDELRAPRLLGTLFWPTKGDLAGRLRGILDDVGSFKLRLGSKMMSVPTGTHQIGRMADCWLTLEDEQASRYHARLHVDDEHAELEDLGSRNGTFVNDEQIQGRVPLRDGDKIRIGREVILVLGGGGAAVLDDEDSIRHTLPPGDDGRFPTLMSQLVEKSLKAGKIKDAERYALALTNQLGSSRVGADHPVALTCVKCLLGLADRTSEAVWIDRVFRLHTSQAWLMHPHIIEQVRGMLDHIPRVPGGSILEYEKRLRQMAKDGANVPSALSVAISEMADAYARG